MAAALSIAPTVSREIIKPAPRIKSTVPLRAGDTAVVVKRSGQARRCIVGRVLWTGEDGACLATIAMSVANKSAPRVARSSTRAIEVTDASEREPEYQAANDDGRFADEWEGVGS